MYLLLQNKINIAFLGVEYFLVFCAILNVVVLLQVTMQSNSAVHSAALGLGSYGAPLPNSPSHLPPLKGGGAASSAPPHASPDPLECGGGGGEGGPYTDKSPNSWKYQSFQVL